MKWLRRIAIGTASLLGLLVLAIAALLFWLRSDPGRSWLTAELNSLLSSPEQRLTLSGLGGALPFHPRLARIELADPDGNWLALDDAAVDLDPAALLAGTLRIETLTAGRVALLRLPAGGAPTPTATRPAGLPALPQLPVGIELGRLAVGRIELPAALLGETAALSVAGKAALHAGLAEATLVLDRLDGAAGHAELHLDYGGPERLGLELHIAEPSGAVLATILPDGGRRPFTLDLGGAGTLADWRGKLDVQAGADASAHADLTLGRSGGDTTAIIAGMAALAPLLPAPLRPGFGDALRFDLAASLADAGPIGLDRLTLTLGAGALRLTGRYDTASGALTAKLDTDIDPAPLQGLAQIDLGGRIHAMATAGGTLQAPTLQLAVEAKDLQIATTGIAALTATLDAAPASDGRLQVTSSGRVDGVTGSGAPPSLGDTASWTVALEAARDGGQIDVTHATLSGGGLDLDASGQIIGRALAGHVHLAAGDLERFAGIAGTPLAGAAEIEADATSADGKSVEAKLSGKLSGFRTGVPAADALLGGAVSFGANARRDGDGPLDVSTLEIAGPGVSLTASGRLDAAGKAMEGHSALEVPRLGALGTALGMPIGGTLRLMVDTAGSTDDPSGTATIAATGLTIGDTRLDRLDSKVTIASLAARAAKVTAKAAAGQVETSLSAAIGLTDAKIVRIDELRLDGPATRATGALALDLKAGRVAGTLDAEASDLAAWAPVAGHGIAGRVKLAAKFADQAGQGADVTLDADRLGYDAAALQHLHLALRLADLLNKPRGTIELTAAKLTASGTALDTVKLQAEAKAAGNFGFTASAAGRAQDKQVSLATAGRVEWSGANQTLVLTALDGKAADLPFRLARPLTATRTGNSTALTGLALALGGGTVSGRAVSDGKTIDLALMAEKLPLGALARLGGQRDIAGAAGLEVALTGPLSAPKGHVILTVPDLKVDPGAHPELPALQVAASAELLPDTVTVKGRIDGVKHSLALGFAGAVPIAWDAGTPSLRRDGTLTAKLEGEGQLEELGEVLPLGEDKAGGRIAVDLTLGGTPAAPQAGGKLVLDHGIYDNDASGLALRDLTVELDGDRQAFVLHRFEANDGARGKLSAQGKIDLAAAAGPMLDMTATLARFTLSRGDDVTATVDGKILVSGALTAPKLSADLTMPRAEINIPDQLPASVPELDVVRMDSRQSALPPKLGSEAPEPPIAATLDIRFHDPGQTFVRGRGLTSEWNGDIKIFGTSAAPQITGEFDVVNGTFDALGKTFTVERGVLRFDGGVLPSIDLTADIQAADITAEILVRGPPTRPEVTLSSIPTLPQDEVLSRILFGTGVGQITPAQGLQLAQAAATLAGGGPGVLDRLRNAIGLDRLSVGDAPGTAGGGAAGTTVSGGKYIAPGIFVGADQGLSGTSTRGKVEVEITPNISLKATAGAGSDASSLGVQYKLDY